MAIWYKSFTLEEVQQRGRGTMIDHIGIIITEVGDTYLKGTMPVDHRTVQPMGILHGGASVALAETLGSLAANLVVDSEKKYCVGLLSIEITDEENKLVCISRLTMAVLEKK